MGKRSKQKKTKQGAKGQTSGRPWDGPGKASIHGGFNGRAVARPQTNLRQGRGR